MIGTISAQFYPFKIARIRQVVVLHNSQSHGVGAKLLASAEAFVKNRGYKYVILSGRKSAVLFYLKKNYTQFFVPFTKHSIKLYWLKKNLQAQEMLTVV